MLGKVILGIDPAPRRAARSPGAGPTDETGGEVPNVLLGHQRAMKVWRLISVGDLDRQQVAGFGRLIRACEACRLISEQAEGPIQSEVGPTAPGWPGIDVLSCS